MLVLSRKTDESLRIGENIEIVVQRIGGGRVRLGIKAPADVRIMRTEVDDAAPPRDRGEAA
jgi:carbon storage regulator